MGKIVQARVLQRDQAHEHVAVAALAADLLGVHARGLVAVVAVGDQQLRPVHRVVHGADRVRVGDPPQAVARPVGVGDVAERGGSVCGASAPQAALSGSS